MNVFDSIPQGGPDRDREPKRPKVRTPGPNETLELAPLEDGVGWYKTHFVNRRTKPCLGDKCICQKAEKPLAARWQGYILCKEGITGAIVLAQLTRNCWDVCAELRQRGVSLRGSKLILSRKGGAQGIVVASVVPDSFPPRLLPRLPYNHQDQLYRVWFNGVSDYADVSKLYGVNSSENPLLDGHDQADDHTGGKEGAA